MRNTKLWSVLLVCVLLCACVLGVLFTGASAADVAKTYTVNTANTENDEASLSFKSIADALSFAAEQEWKTNETLVIKFTGTEAAKVGTSELAFGQKTIWRRVDIETGAAVYGNKLPIEIVGQSGSDADTISVTAKIACANDYTFKDLTLDNWTNKVAIYAGSGQITLKSLKSTGSSNTGGKMYADSYTAEAFEGWYAEDFNALKDEDDCILTALTFMSTTYYAVSSNSTATGVGAVGTAYADSYSYTAPSANGGESFVITPEKTKAQLEVGSGANVQARLGGYVPKTPARVHTVIVKMTDGGKSKGVGGDSGASLGATITNGNIEIILDSPVFSSLGVRVLYGTTMVNTPDIKDNADGSVEYGNITLRAKNVTGYDGNSVFIDGSGNRVIPGKCIVDIDGWSGTTHTTDHTKSSTSHEFEYIGIGAKKGIETRLKGCLLQAYSGTRMTKSTAHTVSFPIKNELIDCQLATRYYVSDGKNSTAGNMYSAVSFRSDTPLNHKKDKLDENGDKVYGSDGKVVQVADPLTANVGDVTNIWRNVRNEWSYYGVGSVPFTKVGNVVNDIADSYIGGHAYGVGVTADVGTVTNIYDTVEFVADKDFYGTFGSSAVSPVSGAVENIFSGTVKVRDFYGTCYGTSDSVTNTITGGEYRKYFGSFKTTVSANIENSIGAATFTGELKLTNDGSCKEIINTFDGITNQTTMNCSYNTVFSKVTNTFKSGTFSGSVYGCFGNANYAMGDVYNYIQGGSFKSKNYIFGGYGGKSIKSVTNEVTGNPQFTFKASDVGSGSSYQAFDGVCFGSGSRMWPSKVLGNVTTTIKGGTFKGHVLGGGHTCYVVGDIVTNVEAGSFSTFFGAGYGGCNSTDSSKTYLQTEYGKICGGTVKNIFGKAGASEGPTFSSYVFGGDTGSTDGVVTAAFDILNTVNAATFNGNYYGGSDTAKSNVKSITNVVNGGTFVKRFYGGSNNTATGSVKNVINGGSFNGAANVDYFCAYFGGYNCEITGGVENEINGGTYATYVIAGTNGAKISNANGAAIKNTISGGTFHNFWGGNSKNNNISGDIVNEISGGLFDSFKDSRQTYPNCFNGGNRNGAHAGGNIINTISGGVFKWHFTAGNNAHQLTYGLAGVEPAYAVTTNITGGIFEGHVYANYKPGTVGEGDFYFATATLNITQTEGKELAFYASVEECDSFAANGEAIKIGKNTKITAENVSGTVSLNQTQGWLQHDYFTIVSGTGEFGEITTASGAFGKFATKAYVVGEDPAYVMRVYGVGTVPVATSLILDQKLTVRVLFDPEEIAPYGTDFTFAAVMGENALDTVFEEYTVDGVTYASYLIKGIGLGNFTELIEISGAALDTMEFSVVSLADGGAEYYETKNEIYAQLFKSIADLGRKENREDTKYDLVVSAVKWTPGDDQKPKELDTRLSMKTMGLIMSDAIGIRLTGDTAEALKFIVNGKDVTSNCVVTASEGTFTADMYVKVSMMTSPLNIVITDANDTAMFSMTVRVDALAEQIADSTEEDAQLIDFALAYIQAADAYVKA